METFSPATRTLALDDVAADKRDARARWFLLALLLSTWVPLIFFVSLTRFPTMGIGVVGIRTVLLFLGTAHVPATIFFYTDKEFARIIGAHRVRFLYVPILLAIGSGLLFALSGPLITGFALLGYWGWQAFHYGRQNLGVYAFVSIAEKKKTASKLEKLSLDLATICGIMGTFKILGTPVTPAGLHGLLDLLYRLGRFGFLLVVGLSILVYVKNFKDTSPLKSIFFFTLIFFFGPLYLSENMNVAFLSYAIAHGIQYIVFMSVVSANSRPSGSRALPMGSVITFLVLLLVGGFIFYNAADLKTFEFIKGNALLSGAANFVFGAILGLTMAHFVVDAGAWRLSKAAPRAYMARRFGFLLNPRIGTEA